MSLEFSSGGEIRGEQGADAHSSLYRLHMEEAAGGDRGERASDAHRPSETNAPLYKSWGELDALSNLMKQDAPWPGDRLEEPGSHRGAGDMVRYGPVRPGDLMDKPYPDPPDGADPFRSDPQGLKGGRDPRAEDDEFISSAKGLFDDPNESSGLNLWESPEDDPGSFPKTPHTEQGD